MPDAEKGAGDGGEGVGGEVEVGEGGGQAAVLHTDFDADGAALGGQEVEGPADQVADAEAAEVVEHDDQQDDPAAVKQFVGVGSNDDEDDGANGQGRQGRQVICGAFGRPGPKPLHDQAQGDGQDDHPEDAQQHSEDIDIDRLPRQQPDQQRRQHGGQEGRCGRHPDGKRQVALGQIGDDVRGRAARAAPHEDDTDGERRIQPENPCQCKRQERHHRELRQAADDDVPGAGKHHAEVFRLECQAHPEHNDAQQRIDERRLQPAQGVREKKGRHCRQQHQHAHQIRYQFADLFHRRRVIACRTLQPSARGRAGECRRSHTRCGSTGC